MQLEFYSAIFSFMCFCSAFFEILIAFPEGAHQMYLIAIPIKKMKIVFLLFELVV